MQEKNKLHLHSLYISLIVESFRTHLCCWALASVKSFSKIIRQKTLQLKIKPEPNKFTYSFSSIWILNCMLKGTKIFWYHGLMSMSAWSMTESLNIGVSIRVLSFCSIWTNIYLKDKKLKRRENQSECVCTILQTFTWFVWHGLFSFKLIDETKCSWSGWRQSWHVAHIVLLSSCVGCNFVHCASYYIQIHKVALLPVCYFILYFSHSSHLCSSLIATMLLPFIVYYIIQMYVYNALLHSLQY